ncbi:MAG: hypothetical protein KatS3mg033_2449 [Thermonema sp.]|uniref:M28 family peptidase n=1 Tax=Thermonema sp. TaxID=2231181 RepID=UPI0021DE6D23|nr:M28 family peptidase [Thermonema sp.]GIV40649.1 MAG: hypothetical protein KatS3mg033_2449 [Thermonema sp.]
MQQIVLFISLLWTLAVIPAAAQSVQADIAGAVNQVSVSRLQALLQEYEQLGIKNIGSQNLEATRAWIKQCYLDMGYAPEQISEHAFSYTQKNLYNIVITKEGSLFPHIYIYLTAHYDSTPNGPGVNDNGSGTVALLEIARIIQSWNLPYSVRLVHFSAEEVGLVGSKRYVSEVAVPRHIAIRALINLDEVGGDKNKNNTFVHCERDESNTSTVNNAISAHFTQRMANITELYTSLNAVVSHAYASDYMPFEAAGYNIMGFYESYQTAHYHSSTDLLQNMDVPYFHKVVQAALATLLHFAGEVPPQIERLSPQAGDSLYRSQPDSLLIDYDRPLQYFGGKLQIHRSSDDQVVQSITLQQNHIQGKSIKIALSEKLAPGQGYYVTLPFGWVSGADGILTDSLGKGQWQFYVKDETPPAEPASPPLNNDTPQPQGLQLYPNPAGQELHIQLNGVKPQATLRVFNNEGKLIHEQSLTSTANIRLDISQWARGVYFIKVEAKQKQWVRRFEKVF